jgi:hypothetical protein
MSMSKPRFNRLSVLLSAALGLLLGAALRSSAGTLFVDLRDVTTQGLTNRRVILTPLSTPAGGAGTVIVSDRISLLATNAFYVSNLVAGTYAIELQAPPTLTRFQCTMPDTNGVVNLVSILTAGTNDTGTAAYAWTMSAADLRYPSLFGTGLSATEVNGRLQLTATGTTESVVPTNAIASWISASNAPLATTNWVKLYVATNATAGAITNLQTLPMFTDGVQFTNPASGQRGRLELREFLGTPWLWFSNGVFESAYFSGNGASLTALNADNIAGGNLDVARLNGGTGASTTTYWRGDGTWATPAGGSGGVATLNGSATNLTMRGDTSIYGGADTVVQVTSDSPGELYGFGAWTVDQVASTNFVGNGANLSNVTARYVAASNITSGGSVPLAALHPSVLTNRTREVVTNLDSGFVLETTGGYLKGRIVPFTNPTRPGLQIHAADTLIVTVETNALSVAGAAPIYANGAGITNIPGASITGTLTNQVTCALFNVATNWADATNRFVLSPTNGNWQQLTLTNAAYIAVDASSTNSGSTFRLTILGSNAVTWTTSNLSNAPAAALNASVTELLLDRSPYTNLWNLTKFR